MDNEAKVALLEKRVRELEEDNGILRAQAKDVEPCWYPSPSPDGFNVLRGFSAHNLATDPHEDRVWDIKVVRGHSMDHCQLHFIPNCNIGLVESLMKAVLHLGKGLE